MMSLLITEHCTLGNRCGAEQIGLFPGQLKGDADLCLHQMAVILHLAPVQHITIDVGMKKSQNERKIEKKCF